MRKRGWREEGGVAGEDVANEPRRVKVKAGAWGEEEVFSSG